MKLVFKILAFCACGYLWLGVLFQSFVGPDIVTLPDSVVAYRAFAGLITLCCLVSLLSCFWAASVSWLGTLVYLVISWRANSAWVFRSQLIFLWWAPLLLTLAAYLERREEKEWLSPLPSGQDQDPKANRNH
jgi:hypothetical protein